MDWLARWHSGNTGWHESQGNAALREYWPGLEAGRRVLVPLCGKTNDMLWLAEQGHDVTGVEFSEVAAKAFFDEAEINYAVDEVQGLFWYRAVAKPIAIACCDYFEFSDQPFDALYDRAALVALSPSRRIAYIRHTKSLLNPSAVQLLITLEYDQSKASGPPYSVMPEEVTSYWKNLQRTSVRNDIEYSAPKFRDAGMKVMNEVVWVSGSN